MNTSIEESSSSDEGDTGYFDPPLPQYYRKSRQMQLHVQRTGSASGLLLQEDMGSSFSRGSVLSDLLKTRTTRRTNTNADNNSNSMLLLSSDDIAADQLVSQNLIHLNN